MNNIKLLIKVIYFTSIKYAIGNNIRWMFLVDFMI
jgi:hypothetical protein